MPVGARRAGGRAGAAAARRRPGPAGAWRGPSPPSRPRPDPACRVVAVPRRQVGGRLVALGPAPSAGAGNRASSTVPWYAPLVTIVARPWPQAVVGVSVTPPAYGSVRDHSKTGVISPSISEGLGRLSRPTVAAGALDPRVGRDRRLLASATDARSRVVGGAPEPQGRVSSEPSRRTLGRRGHGRAVQRERLGPVGPAWMKLSAPYPPRDQPRARLGRRRPAVLEPAGQLLDEHRRGSAPPAATQPPVRHRWRRTRTAAPRLDGGRDEARQPEVGQGRRGPGRAGQREDHRQSGAVPWRWGTGVSRSISPRLADVTRSTGTVPPQQQGREVLAHPEQALDPSWRHGVRRQPAGPTPAVPTSIPRRGITR